MDSLPRTDVRRIAGDDPTLRRDLRTSVLDTVFLALPLGDLSLKEAPLWVYETVFVVLPPRYRECQVRKGVAGLHDKPFIVFKRPVILKQAIPKLCSGTGFIPNAAMEHEDPTCILELVKLGIGYSTLPLWIAGAAWKRKELSVFRGSEPSMRLHGLVYRASSDVLQSITTLTRVAMEWRTWWTISQFVHAVSQAVNPEPITSV
jgi:DNA-binding transcriptional LysR family regulator